MVPGGDFCSSSSIATFGSLTVECPALFGFVLFNYPLNPLIIQVFLPTLLPQPGSFVFGDADYARNRDWAFEQSLWVYTAVISKNKAQSVSSVLNDVIA